MTTEEFVPVGEDHECTAELMGGSDLYTSCDCWNCQEVDHDQAALAEYGADE